MGQWLKDKCAVVTGSGQGVGKAIAVVMAKEGAKVVTNNRQQGTVGGDAEITAEEIKAYGGQAVACFGDVSQEEDAKKLIQTCVDKFGRVDILVNSAGIALGGFNIWDGTVADFDATVAVNQRGMFLCCRAAIPIMMQQKSGRIVNLTSITWLGAAYGLIYAMTKGGIVSATYSLAQSVAPFGGTCNAIAPEAATRLTLSDETKVMLKNWLDLGAITKEAYDEYTGLVSPEYVAAIAAYLGTDQAAKINGKVFRCGANVVSLFSEPVEVKGIYKDIEKEGPWTVDELMELMPKTVAKGMV